MQGSSSDALEIQISRLGHGQGVQAVVVAASVVAAAGMGCQGCQGR